MYIDPVSRIWHLVFGINLTLNTFNLTLYFVLPKIFADIVFPTAVRAAFTYHLDEKDEGSIQPGMRVWVPLQSHMAIGMVVKVHNQKPAFRTRPVRKILDEKPIMSEEMLRLTEWVHRFYYASWGETIQAALPVGLNFLSEKFIRPATQKNEKLNRLEEEIVSEVVEKGSYSLREAEKRWKEAGAKCIRKLIKRNILEIWEEPRIKVQQKLEKKWQWTEGIDERVINNYLDEYQNKKTPKWIKALYELQETGLPLRQSQLEPLEFVDSYSINRIEKEGLITFEWVPVKRDTEGLIHDPEQIKSLNIHQQEAYERIASKLAAGEFQNFLLYGVTGSGKTEVYIHVLRKALEMGKGALVLVPEIALTPQTVRRFYQIFGDRIAVLHSRLNERERYEAWRDLQNGRKNIAIGARSAVFAPIRDLGVIVIDEEHDQSYKQEDPAPRYHAREVAIMRAFQTNSVIVLGSATPSMVSLHSVDTGKCIRLDLPSRHAQAQMPEVKIIDMKKYHNAMRGPLAVPLFLEIEQALARNEQVILLYNRRGFASYMQCEECGHIVECPHCSVSLTYHKYHHHLRCHYCGYSLPETNRCPNCHALALTERGSGTQQIEEGIEELFPEARILRMDQDTTSGKGAHARILNQFGAKKADILVGTQIVAKGLDFPDVTVVGVVNSDTELAFPSYRSSERMYQLLSQVAGRSGRSDKPGIVYFQTWQPEHPAIKMAQNHDFDRFAHNEMENRRQLSYPPFSRLLEVSFRSVDSQLVKKVADVFSGCLSEAGGNASILGPSPSAILRANNEFRWECMLKIDPTNGAKSIERLLDQTWERYEKKKPKGASKVKIRINVDAM